MSSQVPNPTCAIVTRPYSIEFSISYADLTLVHRASAAAPPPPSLNQNGPQQANPSQVNHNIQDQNAHTLDDAQRKSKKKHSEGSRSVVSHYRESSRGDRKIQIEEADFYCLDGFELNVDTSRCERRDEVPANSGCPHGWDYDDETSQCSTTIVRPADRYCAEGFEDFQGRCQRTLKAPRQLHCPPAYTPSDFGCLKDVETAPALTCDAGELVHGLCVDRVMSTPVALCAPGFTRNGSKCARRRLVVAEPSCPTGFVDIDGVCLRTTEKAPVLLCSGGAQLMDDVCIKLTKVPEQYLCRDGVTASMSDQCHTSVAVAPTVACRKGAELIENLCIVHETAGVVESCPAGAVLKGEHCVNGKGPVVKSKDCPPGFGFKDKGSCVRKTTLPTELVCPPGLGLTAGPGPTGSVCTATDYSPPEPICPEGTLRDDTGVCLARETFMAEKTCELGYALDAARNLCISEATAEKLYSCLLGTFDPREGGCVLAEVVPADVGCPPNAPPISGSNGELACEERVTTQPRALCPPDFSMKDDGTSCLGRALTDGQLTCVAPYTDNGVECTFHEVLPKIMGCVDGGFLKGTSCIAADYQAPIVMCPESYTYSADSQLCRKLLWSKSTPICPDQFIFDNLVQKCFKFGGSAPQAEKKKPDEESLLPLESMAPSAPSAPGPVKAKVHPQGAGKEQFVPIQTFRGPDAMQQAQTMEAAKMMGGAASPVRVPAMG